MRWSREELNYCTNVHPGAKLSEVTQNIHKYISAVASARSLSAMQTGFWLANSALQSLNSSQSERLEFIASLAKHQISIGTLNGFPYGNFHQAVVKQKVYLPTWADTKRLNYSLELAKFYASLMADTCTIGSISTLPLGYAKAWSKKEYWLAADNLCSAALGLAEIEQQTGKYICICIEMEPDCVLETTAELIAFFEHTLKPAAAKRGLSASLLTRYIACCFDTCHQAVMHEDILQSLTQIKQAGIHIGKIQISNALSAKIDSWQQAQLFCQRFSEKKFLHQVKIGQLGNVLYQLEDLNIHSIQTAHQTIGDELFKYRWHIHFHVPIHLAQIPSEEFNISTTQSAITQTLDFLANNNDCKPALEVETYSWLQYENSQANKKFNLVDGINQELQWLEQQLAARNLLQ